ncbi:hypothetical protein F4553_006105 [Allocatelliglobosispora scoriae]|uniref:DUF4240 domain-containing protein n=1 Tax=Allocatelliglobosispora scoriae TaxID=643052 RepID=A0A841C1C1_9ACTN|nr:DUF4240 domain-containing protein [Allocatelliglobosispora scoriae]MBB5872671.1 hypothetical protein [Allocatelliglobosispora scoriae]
MDHDGFWRLIDESGTHYRQRAIRLKWLELHLAELPPAEIVDFHILLDTCRERVDNQAMWGAAHQICDGIGGDSFWYFQAWLFSLGRTAFEHAAASPDNLADLDAVRRLAGSAPAEWGDEQWPEWEGLNYVARYAFDEATDAPRDGEAIEEQLQARGHASPSDPAEPTEQWWDLDDPAEALRRYPKLAAIFPRNGNYQLLVPEEERYPAVAEPAWHAYNSDGSSWMDPQREVLAVFLDDLRQAGDWLVLNRIGGTAGYAQVELAAGGLFVSLHQADQPTVTGHCDSGRTALAVLTAWAAGATGWPAGVTWQSADQNAQVGPH